MEGLGKLLQALFVPQPRIADCPHCSTDERKTILKYRGSVKYETEPSDYEALKDWKIDKRIKQLSRYSPGYQWASTCKYEKDPGEERARRVKDLYYYSFVACDECIQPEHTPAFTHFPDGWEMKVFKTKKYGPYDEEINFDMLEEASSPEDRGFLPNPLPGF